MKKLSPTRRAAYKAAQNLGFAIWRPSQTDARALTSDQAIALANWERNSRMIRLHLDDDPPLQVTLDLYHASIVYDGFDSYFDERPREAQRALQQAATRAKEFKR